MTEMFGEAWSPMSVPDLAPDDDDDSGINWSLLSTSGLNHFFRKFGKNSIGIKTGVSPYM